MLKIVVIFKLCLRKKDSALFLVGKWTGKNIPICETKSRMSSMIANVARDTLVFLLFFYIFRENIIEKSQ
mgnify:CR=1 FL=1|jgi:hypothetical protein